MQRLGLILFIAAASFTDAILTDFGLRLGSIGEANPLMLWLYQWNAIAFFLLKLSLPLLLLLVIPKLLSKVLQNLLYLTSAIYLCILSLHGVWLLEQFTTI
ncbi:hypothetical protein EHS13_24955 [Paenibacillus psychroresistens]|uniref:DUF5658 domain-containing protein n=1 Tax=Paenibacillus psychroresistens TaxID=1778678 RepID=A0A6B8RQ21_9BACL|nr:DUF5658 family protein [Paenibacillus psychroresistens]QGQ97904.1 hypothetical protein EHS13_24955 [Paenibacillus psychroresistens]